MSVYSDILTAVRSLVAGLGLTDLPTTSVKRRPAAYYLAEHDPVPLLVVSPNLDSLDQLQFEAGGFFTYEVRLAIYQETAFKPDDPTDLDWLLDVRQAIRQALFVTTLAGAPTVFDVAWLQNPVFDTGVLPAGVAVSRMAFVYTSDETRTG